MDVYVNREPAYRHDERSESRQDRQPRRALRFGYNVRLAHGFCSGIVSITPSLTLCLVAFLLVLSTGSQEDLDEPAVAEAETDTDTDDEFYEHLTEEDFDEIDSMLAVYSDRVDQLATKITDQQGGGECVGGARGQSVAAVVVVVEE